MTPEERAKPIAEAANECCHRSDGYEEDIAAQIAAAIRQAENEALERALEVAEYYAAHSGVARSIQKAISALKHPEPQP